jgi:hypothetical protein
MKRTPVLLVLGIAVIVGGRAVLTASPPEQRSAGAAREQASNLLNTLRQQLERVALARSRNERFDIRDLNAAPVDVTSLVGVSRKTLSDALGVPSVDCRQTPVTSPDLSPARIAPCRSENDLAYSFYALPRNWVGGGPELLLEFNARDECVRASWVSTQ